MVRSISILGCTGSIGRQTAAVAEHTGIRVAALTANRKIDLLEEQARKFRPTLPSPSGSFSSQGLDDTILLPTSPIAAS